MAERTQASLIELSLDGDLLTEHDLGSVGLDTPVVIATVPQGWLLGYDNTSDDFQLHIHNGEQEVITPVDTPIYSREDLYLARIEDRLFIVTPGTLFAPVRDIVRIHAIHPDATLGSVWTFFDELETRSDLRAVTAHGPQGGLIFYEQIRNEDNEPELFLTRVSLDGSPSLLRAPAVFQDQALDAFFVAGEGTQLGHAWKDPATRTAHFARSPFGTCPPE